MANQSWNDIQKIIRKNKCKIKMEPKVSRVYFEGIGGRYETRTVRAVCMTRGRFCLFSLMKSVLYCMKQIGWYRQ